MRGMWSCLVFAAALLVAPLGAGFDAASAAGGRGGFASGINAGRGIGTARGIGGRVGMRRFSPGMGRFGDGRFNHRFGRRNGRDYGGYGYGYGSSSSAYGGGEGAGERSRVDNSGYPVALGIRPAPSRPPTTYVVGSRGAFAAARRGTMNRSGRGGPLSADSDAAEGASGVDNTHPRVIRVP
jgi:hypothetical protein